MIKWRGDLLNKITIISLFFLGLLFLGSCTTTSNSSKFENYPTLDEIPSAKEVFSIITNETILDNSVSHLTRIHMALSGNGNWQMFFTYRIDNSSVDWNSIRVDYSEEFFSYEHLNSGYLTPYFFKGILDFEEGLIDSTDAFQLALDNGGNEFIENYEFPTPIGSLIILDLHPVRSDSTDSNFVWSVSFSSGDANIRWDINALSGELIETFRSSKP